MSLALVGDRKGIRSGNLLPLVECTFPPLLFLHHCPFSWLRRTWCNSVKEDVWRLERENQRGNWLTQFCLEGVFGGTLNPTLLLCLEG